MKAYSIALRIADFLRKHPPFDLLREADLVDLAAAGRVKFHEEGEVVFSQGQPRDRFVYVINEGRVRIVEESPKGENLIDLRGAGDLLGLQGVISDVPYTNTAITETDVLLYALPRERLVELTEKSPPAQRYLASYFSLNPAYVRTEMRIQSEGGAIVTPITLRKGGLGEVEGPQAHARSSLSIVKADIPAVDAAKRLVSKRVECLVVIDAAGRPIGKLTDADLRDNYIAGKLLPEAKVGDLMFTDLALAKPTDNTGKLLVRLARSGKRFLVVTEDGTADTAVLGTVSERNIFLQYGRFPTLIGEAITEAPDVASLRQMRDRIEALILEFLEDRSEMRWLMEMTGVLNRRLSGRILELMEAEMLNEGWVRPKEAFTWLMIGSGGRDELLIRSAVYHALVYEDPPEEVAEQVRDYYQELGRRTSEGLRQCGFRESVQGVLARYPQWCLPISTMKARFADMIACPREANVYDARDAFDFRPVDHRSPLAIELREAISREIAAHPEFITQMASDSLINQPPRTIYQDYVVHEGGLQDDEFQIKSHALLPLVDAARVLNLEQGSMMTTATHRRLREEAKRIRGEDPAASELLKEAAEAFVVAAFARTKRGLLAGTDGAVIRPGNLDSETRALLKTSLRTILSVLEYVADRYALTLRA
jgi:CBS domain-containing protein